MTIVGRLTRDAVVNSLKDEREVVNFTLAVNDYYKLRNGEAVKVATYYNCAYWITPKVAANLKKGTLVEVTGRIFVAAYAGADGTAKASLNCHVNNIKIHAWPKEVEVIGKAAANTATEENTDDVPFNVSPFRRSGAGTFFKPYFFHYNRSETGLRDKN